MGAVIELTIFCDKIIGFDEVTRQLDIMNYKVDLESVEIFDDWEYSNHQELNKVINFNDINKYVLENKIVLVNFNVNSIWRGGYYIDRVNNHIFEVSVWLNTYNLEYLEIDKITDLNRRFYDELTNVTVKISNQYSILLAGIGVETSIDYYDDITKIIDKSYNVFRWIVPSIIDLHLNRFTKKGFKNFSIYTII